jgi:hypothetical protein
LVFDTGVLALFEMVLVAAAPGAARLREGDEIFEVVLVAAAPGAALLREGEEEVDMVVDAKPLAWIYELSTLKLCNSVSNTPVRTIWPIP